MADRYKTFRARDYQAKGSGGLPVVTFAEWQRLAARLPQPSADAWAVGTRVRKSAWRDGGEDSHKEGDLATVRVRLPPAPPLGTSYVVEWDDMPGVPVLVIATKLEVLQ